MRFAAVALASCLAGCSRAPVAPAAQARPASASAPARPPPAPSGPAPAGEPVALAPPPEPPPASDAEGEAAREDVDDDVEAPADEAAPEAASVSMTEDEVVERLRRDPASLGSLSVGSPSAGALVNGVRMPAGEGWRLVDPDRAWGTQETIDDLVHCLSEARAALPDGPPAYVGHISAEHGGHLSPHKSHQSGRDVDVSYFLTTGHVWYARANAENLDRARTWTLIRAAITDTDVELVLIDSSIQKLLKEYALGIGEDRDWLDDVFQVGGHGKRPLIRHAKGHATHLHLRFYNPVAEELGRRAFAELAAEGRIKATVAYTTHVARRGDTLGALARRYKTTVKAIQEANRMTGTALHERQTYRIPGVGRAMVRPPPTRIPARRLPPGLPARAATAEGVVPGAP